jgi:hypothetical protein
MSNHNPTRREFVGGATAAGVGVALGSISGAAPRADATPIPRPGGDPPNTQAERVYFRAVNMVGRVTGIRAVVNLVTSTTPPEPVTARVLWAETPAELAASPSVSATLTQSQANTAMNLVMTGLIADRTYYFQVQYHPASLPGAWTNLAESGEFRTRKSPGQSFDFCVFADPHWGHPNLDYNPDTSLMYTAMTVVNQVVADAPFDFCIDAGDSPFPTESHSQVDTDLVYEKYRWVMGPIMRRMPVYLALGNHEQEAGFFQRGGLPPPAVAPNLLGPTDYHQKWSTASRKKFVINPRFNTYPEGGEGAPGYDTAAEWGAGGDPWNDGDATDLQNFYAWTWGDALFVVLDPYRYTKVGSIQRPLRREDWTLGPTQMQFLIDTISASDARWKFIICHHQVGGGPINGAGNTARNGTREQYGRGSAIEALRPETEQFQIHQLMKQHNVRFFIYGHDHGFAHSVVEGVHYLCCARPTRSPMWFDGSGMRDSYGDPLQYGQDKPWMRALYTSLGYMKMRVEPDSVTMEWIRGAVSVQQAPTYDFSSDFPPRNWADTWVGKPYPIGADGRVQVEFIPTDVDAVRTVSGSALTEFGSGPAGADYYVQQPQQRPESFDEPVVPTVNFPPGQTHAMVDMVPERLYRYTWRLGDMNDDGQIDGDDLPDYVRTLLSGGTPFEEAAADLPAQDMVSELLNPDS